VSPEVTIDPMQLADVERVLPLERRLFGVEAWTTGMFRSEITQRATRWYVLATSGDEVVGYAGLCAYDHEAFVQTIAVDPGRWGQGVGTRLLTELLGEAARRGHDAVILEVRADNDRAQQLYARFGFESIGRRRGYYQPSNTDAIVMRVTGVRATYAEAARAHGDTA
jgi:ribosomal-protein-alanine N-acetyltransferase